ncbi:DNA invertase Pin-like site-specific DNA recombinase [Larkinella arboricola]|uniref:DNA invertase Pin-like site-specific DNA recombinase n=1 Tax=Larkinella arboricola TaxID=643671 RepID=A0A327WH39_LARAB|nr:recombinase family protein [Larkinella arboricola]RAJ89911.1 DNA invertase Pin-like site-specific DNA recombinase [Larkinella arboricola]
MKYVSYIRVSTKGQERSGLSFDAQKAIIEHYAQIDKAEIAAEFIETESGKDIENRPILKEAIQYAQANKCVLVVAKLDRLSRDVEHIFKIQKQLGSLFKSCDLPTTDALTLSIYAGIAQRERELISIRTRQALQAKKRQGAKLGKLSNLTYEGRSAGGAARSSKAKVNQNNQRAKALIRVCREKGMSLAQIAEHLNINGFTTSTGKPFHKVGIGRQVKSIEKESLKI